MEHPMIITNPQILGGKPIIAGTRIAVTTILDLLSSGLSIAEVIAEYPGLTEEAVQTAISFASKRLQRETVQPIIQKDGSLAFPMV